MVQVLFAGGQIGKNYFLESKVEKVPKVGHLEQEQLSN